MIEHGPLLSNQDYSGTSGFRRETGRPSYMVEGLSEFIQDYHQLVIPQGTEHGRDHELLSAAERNATHFMESSDRAAFAVSRPSFRRIIERQKTSRRATVGVTGCIDGRIAMSLNPGPICDTFEAKAGIPGAVESKLTGELDLESRRLGNAIFDRSGKDAKQLLQILPAHANTAKLESPDCLAMVERLEAGLVNNPTSNLIEANLEELEKAADAIRNRYNRGARYHGVAPLKKVGVTAVIDTRTQGYIFDYGQPNALFTTDITRELANDPQMHRRFGMPGAFRDTFTKTAVMETLTEQQYEISRYLQQHSDAFRRSFQKLLDSGNYNDLTNEQISALADFAGCDIGFQYTSGLYLGGNHPLSTHNEQYNSFSKDGVRVGGHDGEIQSFGATVSNGKDTVSHLVTKGRLADRIGKMKKPYVSFVSKALQENATPIAERNARADLGMTMDEVLGNDELLKRIQKTELIVIPVFVHEKTGQILKVPQGLI